MSLVKIKTIFWGTIITTALLLGLYIFFVQSTIYYLVATHERSNNGQITTGELSRLEGEYYRLSGLVSEELAFKQGFVPVDQLTYVNLVNSMSVSVNSSDR